MWSSPIELYPVHVAPVQAPTGQAYVLEPQVEYRLQSYTPIQPPKAPYQLMQDNYYSRRLWVC